MHLLLALERLEQAAQRLPAPRLRLVGEVRRRRRPRRAPPLSPCCAMRSVSATSSSRSCSLARRPRPRAAAAAPAPPCTSARGASPSRRSVVAQTRGRRAPRAGRGSACPRGRAGRPRGPSCVGPMSISSEPHDRLLRRAGRDGETRVLGQAREQLHAPLQDLLEVEDRLGEVARRSRAAARPGAGRPPGASPRSAGSRCRSGCGPRCVCGWREVPELLERGHLVADRGAGHADARALRDRLAPDRLAACGRTPPRPRAGPRTCADRARPVRP